MDMNMEQSFLGNPGGWADGETDFYDGRPASPSPSTSEGGDDNQLASDDEDSPTLGGVPLGDPLRTATASEISTYVLTALKGGKNLLIECPPGLDRRMDILQSTLDYYRFRKGLRSNYTEGESSAVPTPSRIYFAAQNFRGMEQVVQEIKGRFETTGHLKNIRMSVLGPKKDLCVHGDLIEKDDITIERECHKMIQNYNSTLFRGEGEDELCPFYSNTLLEIEGDQIFSFVENHEIFEGALLVRDIEDFISHGGKERCRCPFFDSKFLHTEADLVICPIEILLSPVLRREYEIKLQDSILIIDDGHDIESLCYEEGSLMITDVDLRRASTSLRSIAEDYQQQQRQGASDLDLAMQTFSSMVEPLRQFSNWIRDNARNESRPSKEVILEQLSFLRINSTNIDSLCEALARLPAEPGFTISNYAALQKLKKFFTICNTASNNDNDYFMKVIEFEIDPDEEPLPVLKMVCANANVVFGHVERPALSVIVGGDCLAPIDILRTELGVEFHDVLPVVYDPALKMSDRYFFGYCSKGPNEEAYALNYESRGDDTVKLEVAQALLQLVEVVPNGMVVLFHSRRYFDMILSCLRKVPDAPPGGLPSLMTQIEQLKHVIDLSNSTPEAKSEKIEDYRRLSRRPTGSRNGAILFAYARDPLMKNNCHLKDEEIRGIVHVSLPYAAWHHNLGIVARRIYFGGRPGAQPHPDSDNGNHHWYEREAFRIVNQAFARCVNHENDWGLVIILDDRLHSRRQQFHNDLLPAWVSQLNLLRRYKFDRLVEDARHFVSRLTTQAS